MTLTPILLLGAGGHAHACIDVIEREGQHKIVGLVTRDGDTEKRIGKYQVIGPDEALSKYQSLARSAFIAVGQIKSPDVRIALSKELQSHGFLQPVVQSPLAYLSPLAKVACGSILMHGSIVNAGADVGTNCIVNSRALIEHGAKVGDFCHISTGAIINGDARVGAGTFLGSGALVREGVQIGSKCLIGMGARITRDLPDGSVVKGGDA